MAVLKIKVSIDTAIEKERVALAEFLYALAPNGENHKAIEKEKPKKATLKTVAKPVEKPVEKPEVPKPTKEVAEPSVSIQEVRLMLKEKVELHRPIIKKMLSELGSESVTDLDPKHFEAFYTFLLELD